MQNGKKLGAIAIVAGFVVQLVALGAAWGTLTTRVSTIEQDTNGMPERLARVEEKIDGLRELLRRGHKP